MNYQTSNKFQKNSKSFYDRNLWVDIYWIKLTLVQGYGFVTLTREKYCIVMILFCFTKKTCICKYVKLLV